MNRKTLFLVASILSFIAFIGYMTEPGPHEMFGAKVNIWIVRAMWFFLALSNFLSYRKELRDGK